MSSADKPWLTEPSEWWRVDDDGLVLLAARGNGGAWCGYLGLPLEMDYDHTLGVDVYGGLTYEGAEAPGGVPTTMVMAMAVSGRSPAFWIGFDCSHAGDLVPYHNWSSDGVYRDLEFVRQEIKRMAAQVRGREEP